MAGAAQHVRINPPLFAATQPVPTLGHRTQSPGKAVRPQRSHPHANELVLSSRGCTLMQTEVLCPHCQAALPARREGSVGHEDTCPQCGAAVAAARGATLSASADPPW